MIRTNQQSCYLLVIITRGASTAVNTARNARKHYFCGGNYFFRCL